MRKRQDIKEPETAVDVETMKAQVKQFLSSELSLELSSDKTLITHVNSGFSFLGFQIKRYRTRNGYQTLTSVPDDKIRKFKQKIQMATKGKGAFFESIAHKVTAMNKIINGWAEYYKYTNWKGKQIPVRMDYYINQRMFRWAKRKHDKLPYTTVIGKYKHRQQGIRIDGKVVDRWNFGVKTEASFVTDEEVIWLAKLTDKPTEKYRPKRKLNPFLSYQYEVEQQHNILDNWEGRGGNHPYINDEYWHNRKLALKRDNYQCQLCGKRITLGVDNHCHHIDGNSRNQDISNLTTLCIECHYQTYYKEHELKF
jgi:RNA-directed DNA polymerase